MPLPPSFRKYLPLAFWLPVMALVILNGVHLQAILSRAQMVKKVMPFYFQGLKFSGLNDVFTDVRSVGYYTDRDLKKDEAASQFSQAQYVIAPVVLDLNYADQDFILFDCTSEEVAQKKIEEIGAVALRRNQFGVILARKFP